MNAYTVRINPKSRSKPVSIKEAYALGYHDSEHGFPDGSDYDADLPNWTADIGDAYEEGFQQRDKERRIKTMKKNPIGTAEELIARAHKEGLVDGKNHASKDSYYTKDAPKELKLSYLDGYSKGKRENPSKWAKHSTSKSMLHCGISDGQNGLPPNPEFKHFTAYQMGYEKGKRYNVNPMKKKGYEDGYKQYWAFAKNPKSKFHPAKEPRPGVVPWSFKHGYDDGFKEGLHPSSNYEPTMEDDISVEYMKGWYEGHRDGTEDKNLLSGVKNPRNTRKNSTVRINPELREFESESIAYQDGYEDGYAYRTSRVAEYSKIPAAIKEYKRGFSHGKTDVKGHSKRIKNTHLHLNEQENPRNIRKNSTVRINPSKEYFHDEDPIWVRDQGKYDVESGRPYRGEKYGKLRGEYDNGYNHGLRMEKAVRENRHLRLQFEKNPKSKKQLPFRRFFPKIKPGRPAGGPKGGYWWILDIFDAKDRKLGHLIGKGTKEKATLDAKYKVGDKYRGKTIERAMLSGPYDRKPTSKTKRK